MKNEISLLNTRKTQVLFRNKWKNIDAMNIKKGMLFRVFELDGTPVEEGTAYIASGDSYLNANGIITTPYNFSSKNS